MTSRPSARKLRRGRTNGRGTWSAWPLLPIPDDPLDALADAIADRVVARLHIGIEPDRWLTTREAAEYLGLSVQALHKLTATRTIPFEQEWPGAKCWSSEAA